MARQKKNVDWVKLEADYRANIKSLRVLEEEYGISKARIGQVAEENGWTRDIAAKVKARAQAKLDASLLDSKLDSKRKITEKEVIEVAAETQKNIILNHRTDIRRSRTLAMLLLEELESLTHHNEKFEKLGEMMYSPNKSGKDRMNEIYRAVIEHPARVDSMKKLADTLKTLIGSEREAFGIESNTPIDDALKASGIQVSFVAANPQK
jgi:hypothetical protein